MNFKEKFRRRRNRAKFDLFKIFFVIVFRRDTGLLPAGRGFNASSAPCLIVRAGNTQGTVATVPYKNKIRAAFMTAATQPAS